MMLVFLELYIFFFMGLIVADALLASRQSKCVLLQGFWAL